MPKKKKKLSDSFWEIKLLIEKLTTDDDGRRTTTTTDESALEKLRCLSAGGAKKGLRFFIFFDGGDYVAELVDSPRKFFKFWLQMVHSESI